MSAKMMRCLHQHAPHHGFENSSDALWYIGLLRHVGAGVLQRHLHLITVVLELLADELTPFVRPQTFNTETAGNRHRLNDRLKRAESVVLGLQEESLRPLGVRLSGISLTYV